MTSRAVNGVHMVKAYRLHKFCNLKHKCGKNGMGLSAGIYEREEAGCTMGSHMNWVPLVST